MIFLEPQAHIIQWVSQRIRSPHVFDGATAIGVARHGRMVAGFVYGDLVEFNGKPLHMQISMAADSPLWATKETFFTALSYPFHQIGVQRLNAMCSPANKKSKKLLEGVGFTCEARLKAIWPDNRDALLYRLTADEFHQSKWVQDKKEMAA